MSIRRSLAMAWMAGAFAVMLWGWIAYAGPFRWAAEWQLEQFGYYEVRATLFLPLIVLLIPAGFIGGWGPMAKRPAGPPVTRVARARRNAAVIALVGVVALAIGAAAGLLGYHRAQQPLVRANVALVKGDETVPAADLVTLDAVARTDMIVTFSETSGGVTNRWSFVPLVAPAWRAGEPIRFLLKTNQDAWIPPAGFTGPREMHMLRGGNPPFRMMTEPSVLRARDLPGVVRAEYEKARVPFAPTVEVVEQSAGEVLAPYWMTAAGGGLVGLCLILAGLIGLANARKAAGT
jgi:hypothetical protein